MTPWTERVKERMKELDMTQEKLAHKMGITRGAITHYLAGRRVPPLRQFQKMATVLKVEPAWLQFGVSSEMMASSKKVAAKKEKTVPIVHYHPMPVFSWEQAAGLTDVTKIKQEEIKEWLPHYFTDQPRWFALRVKGDSMTAIGGRKSFHEGDVLIIDPDKEATHGAFVIALPSRAKEATFKQYVIDAGIRYLKPLNPQYPILKIEKGTYICGVVVNCIY